MAEELDDLDYLNKAIRHLNEDDDTTYGPHLSTIALALLSIAVRLDLITQRIEASETDDDGA